MKNTYYLVNGTEKYDGMEWLLQVIVKTPTPLDTDTLIKAAATAFATQIHDTDFCTSDADWVKGEITEAEALALNRHGYIAIINQHGKEIN